MARGLEQADSQSRNFQTWPITLPQSRRIARVSSIASATVRTRSRLRTALKQVRTALDSGKSDEVKKSLSDTVSLIDKAAKKGVIHRNAASRYKSRLSARLAS